MDKQALKKHHFWILLALTVILIPVALGGAIFGVGGAAEEKGKKIEAKLKDLDKQQPKSKSYLTGLDDQKAELQVQKNRVWAAAYAAQRGLIHFPERLKYLNQLMDKNKLYFGDEISSADRATFRSPDVYLAEYNHLPELIAPTEFADHSWETVIGKRYVSEFKVMPTSEEVWLALEDLCVEREVLHDIHAVNQMLAEFLPVPQPIGEPAKPKGKAKEELDRYQEEMKLYTKEHDAYLAEKKKVGEELTAAYKVKPSEFAGRFISPYWQLDIVVGRPTAGQSKAGELTFRGKLTNMSQRRQNVARIEFKVWLSKRLDDYAILPVQAEYLAAGASVDFNETRQAPSEPTLAVHKIEQKLDAHYAPVKQLVKLELACPSHRFADKDLGMSAFSDEESKKAQQAAPAAPALGAPGLPGGPKIVDTSFTPNGIPRNRYLERTEQVRRMPVAIVMIVDQGHVQDVIRALSNSRLRFQNTQIHYERFRGLISLDEPTVVGDAPPPTAPPGTARPPIPTGRGEIGRRGISMGGGGGGGGKRLPPGDFGADRRRPGDFGAGHGDPNMNPSVDEENNNLVELTVYGLISLYEQFPPKTPAGPATPAPGVPTAPGLPTPPVPNLPVPPAAAPPVPPTPAPGRSAITPPPPNTPIPPG